MNIVRKLKTSNLIPLTKDEHEFIDLVDSKFKNLIFVFTEYGIAFVNKKSDNIVMILNGDNIRINHNVIRDVHTKETIENYDSLNLILYMMEKTLYEKGFTFKPSIHNTMIMKTDNKFNVLKYRIIKFFKELKSRIKSL